MITIVYERCNALERLELWENIEVMAQIQQIPLLIGGDFNVILNEKEKKGGLPFIQYEVMDFNYYINRSGLTKLKFKGDNFTWWNGRVDNECIFERLDRVLLNQDFSRSYHQVKLII